VTGPEHYREAETCIRQGCASDEGGDHQDALVWLALAQAHATLALAAATGLDDSEGGMTREDWTAWREDWTAWRENWTAWRETAGTKVRW
jgi:hypothetical protein